MELDHVFVFVDDGEAAERAAVRAGLVVTHRRRHHRQGTENVCFRFGDVFLELLWVVDEAEVRSPEVARTGLWERSQWRDTGACPFGVCLRGRLTDNWDYTVPFPPGVSVQMSVDSVDVRRPLLFAFAGRGEVPVHPPQSFGERITGVELVFPGVSARGFEELEAVGVVERGGEDPRLVVTLDGGGGGEVVEIPEARLVLRW